MRLVIDIGNTTLKAAVFDNQEFKDHLTYNIGVKKEKRLPMKQLKKMMGAHDIKQAMVVSVQEEIEELEEYLDEYYEFYRLTHQTPLPIKNRYESPQTLGMDRLALAVGGNGFFPSHDVLVIDVGTCVTYDFVNHKNAYVGGSISPGLKLRLKALHNFTDQLPLVDVKKLGNYVEMNAPNTDAEPFIGQDTEQSIMTGVYYGLLSEIEGHIHRYEQKYPDIKVILTGGDTPYFETPLKSKIFGVPNLLLYGLNKILDHNIHDVQTGNN